MEINKIFICFLITFVNIEQSVSGEKQKLLSRRKRYLVFPEGASLSVAVCMAIGMVGNPQFSIFSYSANYGFAYELPTNATLFLKHRENVFGINMFGYEGDPPPVPAPLPTSTESTTEEASTSSSLEQPKEKIQYLIPEDLKPLPQDTNSPPLSFDPSTFKDIQSRNSYPDSWGTNKFINYPTNQKIRDFGERRYQTSSYPYVSRPMLQRRYRKDLYNKLETAMEQ